MHPHTKKVVMTAISLGIIVFANMIPEFLIPQPWVSEAASCTDNGYANAMFSECDGFSEKGDTQT